MSTHHSFKDAKEAFNHAVSLKLGEYVQDIRKAIQDKKLHVFTISARDQASLSSLTRPICPTQTGKVATAAGIDDYLYQDDLALYEAEIERVKFHRMQAPAPNMLESR